MTCPNRVSVQVLVRRAWPRKLYTAESVERARVRAREMACRRGCDEERAGRFDLAVHEICGNAVKHAGGWVLRRRFSAQGCAMT